MARWVGLVSVHWRKVPAGPAKVRRGGAGVPNREGRAKAIGVANFYPDRLIDLIVNNDIVPAVNQSSESVVDLLFPHQFLQLCVRQRVQSVQEMA